MNTRGTQQTVTMTIPQIDTAISCSLRARGCVFDGEKITFPAGTTRIWDRDRDITAHTEYFKILLPDGYTLTEKHDKKMGRSQLYVPLDLRAEGNAIQQRLENITFLTQTSPSISGLLLNGNSIIIQRRQHPEGWSTHVHQGSNGILLCTWEAPTLEILTFSGVRSYHVRLFEVKSWFSAV